MSGLFEVSYILNIIYRICLGISFLAIIIKIVLISQFYEDHGVWVFPVLWETAYGQKWLLFFGITIILGIVNKKLKKYRV